MLLVFAVAAVLASSGRSAWTAGTDASLLGELPQGLVGHGTRPDGQAIRQQAKGRMAWQLSLPCGLLPVPHPEGDAGPGRSLCPRPVLAAVSLRTRCSDRTSRGPPTYDLPVAKS
jgi:hypothetical protein